MQSGLLYINGTAVTRQSAGDYVGDHQGRLTLYHELLPEGRVHDIVESSDDSMLDDTPAFTVPAGHFFALGDNRDNSLDSRIPLERQGLGFVPIENVIGRVTFIYWSRDWSRIGTRVE
jgi:signal peptidase I